jgi:hypothetical protein
MPAQEYQKDNIKLVCKGLCTNISQDIMPEGLFPFLENTRVTSEGGIKARPKLDIIGNLNPVTPDIAHSIKKLIDKSSALQVYVVGAGTNLYSGSLSVPNLIESGFSGEPLSMVEFRPEESIASFLYIADRLKFRRVGVDNVSSTPGIEPPLVPVTIEVDKPQRKTIDEIGAGTVASWVNGGSAGAVSNQSRINTTITAIILDGVLPNFCSIVPTTFQSSIQPGVQVNLSGTEEVFVEQVYKGLINIGVCVVNSIKYEVGTIGKCVIDLSIPIAGLEVGSVLYINSAEYVRVLDVITGSNGTVSIKVSSVGTFAVGNTIVGVSSFRTYITLAHLAGQTIITDCGKSVIAATGLSTLTKTANLDFTTTANRGLGDNDFFHASILASDASQIDEIQIQADFDALTNDYLHNWYSYAVRVADLLSAVELTSPTLQIQQQVINRQEVQDRYFGYRFGDMIEPISSEENPYTFQPITQNSTPSISDGQMSLGDSQWTEILIPFKNFQKNGADDSRGWKDIKSLRFSIKTKGAVDVYIDSIWVGGGYELDSNDNDGNVVPYRYMARYRESKTKTVSNWSPINREGVVSFRNRHLLSIPNSPDSRVDRKDYARIGGANLDFRILGTGLNDGSKFTDDISDFSLRDNPVALRLTTADNIGDRDFFKPFAILDLPKKGTCNIAGNILTITGGDNIKTSYALGTRILINNVLNTFYTQPTSTTQVELTDNVGTLTGVPFEIKEPLMTGQPLPILVGVFGLGNSGLVLFGAGDINAAGSVYWLDPNSPDTMSDTNRLEITPSSEPIVGGCIYDGFPFFWTNKRSYMLIPSTTENGVLTFTARENANSVGLAHKNALVVAPDAIYYLRHDLTGIDKVQGNGNPVSITDNFISNLFVNNGLRPTSFKPHVDVTINPPDFTRLSEHRLTVAGNYLMYSYPNILGTPECLVFDIPANRWISKDWYPGNAVGAFYGEEAEGDYRILLGAAGQIASFLNTGTYDVINSRILLPYRNQGDIRIKKEYHELALDLMQGSILQGFALKLGFNNNTLYEDKGTAFGDGSGTRIIKLYTINPNDGTLALNISSLLTWNPSTLLEFFSIQYNYLLKPEDINIRPTDLDDAGYFGNKLFQAVTIKTNTNGADKLVEVYDELGILQDTIVINHPTESTRTYSFETPFISHAAKLVPLNENILISTLQVQWVFDKEPEFAKVWEGQPNSYNLPNIKQAKKLYITHRSTSDLTLKLSYDNKADDIYNIPKSNGKRVESFIFLRANKWNELRPRVESLDEFQLYRNGCRLFLVDLTLPNDYQIVNPFGDDSNVTDVRA